VLDMLRRGEVVAGSVLAERAHVRVGDALPIIAGTQRHAFRIAGVATEYTFGGSVAYLDRDVARQRLQLQGVDSFLIKVRPEKIVQLRPKLQALAEREGLLLQSFAELQAIVESMVAGVTGGLWVMLSLGLIVGALGVVNTLTMNVLEQTREIGMLRAIGMRRSEVVKTVVGQAAYLGIIGVGGGALSGVLLARTINRSLGTMFGHFVPFAVRPPFLAVLAISGLAIVLLSALLPAWRAARLNPIEATRHE
jgi:putative ABC transport system permease protein